jgi:hypothetical protein
MSMWRIAGADLSAKHKAHAGGEPPKCDNLATANGCMLCVRCFLS